MRINRYIVGCKSITEDEKRYRNEELIDTQWDVNNVILSDAGATLYRINRYIVGCK